MKKLTVILSVIVLLSGGSVIATNIVATDHVHEVSSSVSHSGRTNSEGCHNDNIHGGYHCH